MKPRHPNPSDGRIWYAIALLATVATAALVYQSRREMSNAVNEFAATAVVLRDVPKLDDTAEAQIRYSILNRTNLDEMIARMGLSSDGGIAEDLREKTPESAEAIVSRLDVKVTPEPEPGRCRIAITCTDLHGPERAICVANYLADHYASVVEASGLDRLKAEHTEAVGQSSVARKAWNEAKSALVAFLDSHFRTLAKRAEPAVSADALGGPLLEGPKRDAETEPRRTEAAAEDAERIEQLQRRLVLLEERRDELSEKLTEAHPDLVAVDDEIVTVTKRVNLLRDETRRPSAELPKAERPKEAASAPVSGAAGPSAAEVAAHRSQFDTYRAALGRSEKTYRDALDKERAAAAALAAGAPVDVHLALGCRIVPAPPSLNLRALSAALFAGLVVGLGVVLLGRTRSVFHRIRTPEEVEAALGVPIAGIVPRSGSRRPHPRRESLILAAFAVLLIVASVLFVWGTTAGLL